MAFAQKRYRDNKWGVGAALIFILALGAGLGTERFYPNPFSSKLVSVLLVMGPIAFFGSEFVEHYLRYRKITRDDPSLLMTVRAGVGNLIAGTGLIALGFAWEILLLKIMPASFFTNSLLGLILVLVGAIGFAAFGAGFIWPWFSQRLRVIRSYEAHQPRAE